jgi:hypothetical protein
MKKKAYPNEFFVSLDDYFEFAMKHKVFGKDAQELRKKMNKQLIPEPKIKMKGGERYDKK